MSQPEEVRTAAGYSLVRNADLAPLTTLRVPARARLLAELYQAAALPALLDEPELRETEEMFVLGGGSNVLFRSDFAGTVLRIATRGIETAPAAGDAVRARIAAGGNWDAFVRWSLARDLAGLENLILIPGTVGAAPIQNIGAYGVELSEFVVSVHVWDRLKTEFAELEAANCAFGYRDSLFKREPARYVVTALELELPRKRALRLDYAGVRNELKTMGVVVPRHGDVARAVERLRLRKLPDPAEIGNAGSFFKNPVVSDERAAELKKLYPALPEHPVGGGRTKLAAAWLIEACGFKGCRDGGAGVSEKHALVIVNYGGATGQQVWALAQRIRDTVAERFGVALEPEPLIL